MHLWPNLKNRAAVLEVPGSKSTIESSFFFSETGNDMPIYWEVGNESFALKAHADPTHCGNQ